MTQAEHWAKWFKKNAKTIPVQYLPSAVVGVVRNAAFGLDCAENKVQAIQKIIEVFDVVTDRKEGKASGDKGAGNQGTLRRDGCPDEKA